MSIIDKAAHERLLAEGERRRQERAVELKDRLDRRRTKKDAAEIAGELGQQFERLGREAIERRKRLEQFVKGLKQKTHPCEKHGELRGLDVDQMSRDSKGDEWVLRWQACPKCELDARSEWLGKVGVPANLLHATLDNWRPANQNDKMLVFTCRQFIRHGRGFLILTNAENSPSKFGIGKSHLAVAILREFGTGRFTTQGDFMLKVRRRYDDRYQEDIVSALGRAKCLVLDELGVGLGGSDELPMLYAVLTDRYDANLPTIITTNLTLRELYGYLGGRLESRLEAAIWKVLELSGANQRRRA